MSDQPPTYPTEEKRKRSEDQIIKLKKERKLDFFSFSSVFLYFDLNHDGNVIYLLNLCFINDNHF